ncbi:MAG: tRNA (adenosine(37)-N6)-threonylcarbamoyltransferase complex dimerization subunit type 1 TsaB [Saprospiraceae bacterium]|nr:tRNA (adenosine(37)-N6)-threonylcarbamoyltransferase complex dimerization subunit type 1 TsaB [Saprospiraceae bacterium]
MMQLINILCLETSTDVCSVAICQNGQLLSCVEQVNTQNHAEEITIMIDQSLKEAKISLHELSAVAVSAGPGSYTGLRIGVNTAKGLCFALEIPLIGLSSLEILANSIQNCEGGSIIMPMIDARRMEVYMATYDHQYGLLSPTEAVIIDENFIKKYEKAVIYLCGNGYLKAIDHLKSAKISEGPRTTSALYMAKISYSYFNDSKFVNYLNFSPYYFKEPNITQPALRKA